MESPVAVLAVCPGTRLVGKFRRRDAQVVVRLGCWARLCLSADIFHGRTHEYQKNEWKDAREIDWYLCIF